MSMWIVIVCALALLAYTYVGYPVLIAVLARLFPREDKADPTWLPVVSCCFAVHNGAAHVAAKLDSLLALDWPADRLEVLVYSDGSTDGTEDAVRAIAARDPRVRLIAGPARRGKPHALNRLRDAAAGEVLFMTDVRQPISKNALRVLVARLADPRVACVSGLLVLSGESGAGFYWKYEAWIRSNEARFRGAVGVTGAIYVVRKSDLADVPDDVIIDDFVIPMRLRLAGRTILLCREAEAHDEAFEDDREFGRKARTLAGNYQAFARWPRLLVPVANPSWFETMSHKGMRLAGPWLAAALLAASIGAAVVGEPACRSYAWVLVVGQGGFYALAAAGRRVGKLGAVARSFVVMNLAAVVGLWRWVRGAQRVTW